MGKSLSLKKTQRKIGVRFNRKSPTTNRKLRNAGDLSRITSIKIKSIHQLSPDSKINLK